MIAGEQGSSGASVSFPRLAGGGHPHRRQGHDQHHRGGAEAAAAVRQPSNHSSLQVLAVYCTATFFKIAIEAVFS